MKRKAKKTSPARKARALTPAELKKISAGIFAADRVAGLVQMPDTAVQIGPDGKPWRF